MRETAATIAILAALTGALLAKVEINTRVTVAQAEQAKGY